MCLRSRWGYGRTLIVALRPHDLYPATYSLSPVFSFRLYLLGLCDLECVVGFLARLSLRSSNVSLSPLSSLAGGNKDQSGNLGGVQPQKKQNGDSKVILGFIRLNSPLI